MTTNLIVLSSERRESRDPLYSSTKETDPSVLLPADLAGGWKDGKKEKMIGTEKTNKWHNYNGISPLAFLLNKIYPLSPEAVFHINQHTNPAFIKKGKFLISPFEENENLYLIIKGVIRGYIKEEGKEITTWINEENEIVGSIRNLGLKAVTTEYLQALEDSVLIAIPKTLIEFLYEHFPETNIAGRILLEDNYRGAEERAYVCRIPSAEKRYKRFLETQPSLLNRIPLKYIASYLGMTLETLSRVRTKMLRC